MSDNMNKITLEFDVADISALVHALEIGRATAMATGNPIAKKRLGELVDMVTRYKHPHAKHFSPENWLEMGICIRQAKTWSIEIDEKDVWRHEGSIVVKIDNRQWKSEWWNFKVDGPEIEEIGKFLELLSPLDAERIIQPKKSTAAAALGMR